MEVLYCRHMKKITSTEPIKLRLDGSTVLEINSKGVICDDFAAKIAEERLGSNVTVEDITLEDAVSEVSETVDTQDVADSEITHAPETKKTSTRGRKANR